MWDKVVKKAINMEAKSNLQLVSGTKEIDSRCLRHYRPLVKKDKDDANYKYRDKAPKDKAKSYNFFSANQSQTQTSKKNKRGSHWGDHLVNKVNTTKVVKKDKDKVKDLSHIKYYTYKQRVTMQISTLKSQKTSGSLGDLYVNDWEDGGNKRIRINTLHLVFRHH